MAGAEAAGPPVAKRFYFAGLRHRRRPAISGHARLLARPAYEKLIALEPVLRRLIPVLIVIFLSIVGVSRFVELQQIKTEREQDARQMIGMAATVLAGRLARSSGDEMPSRAAVLNTLADALPERQPIPAVALRCRLE